MTLMWSLIDLIQQCQATNRIHRIQHLSFSVHSDLIWTSAQ